ncbi:MAG: tail fiber domain-containing protein, partial [Haliscomenobacter sp.]
DGDLHIQCRGDGWTEFKKALYIPNGQSIFLTSVFRIDGNGWGKNAGGFLADINRVYSGIGLLSDQSIAAVGYFLRSDARVKKDLALSNGVRDLATLMRLEVTDYRQVDSLAQGNRIEKGFIAQQVETVYPQAVNAAEGKLPDIYDIPTGYQINGEEATFEMKKPHALAAGDRLHIITEKEPQGEYEVVKVNGSTSFTVRGWKGESPSEKAFVFGKVVSDFRRVDYDKIHTLNVSATQELARQVEALRKENAALKSDVDSLKAENSALKTADARLEARLQAIEARLPNH